MHPFAQLHTNIIKIIPKGKIAIFSHALSIVLVWISTGVVDTVCFFDKTQICLFAKIGWLWTNYF